MKIGMVGYKFMGKAHSYAYHTAPYFFDITEPVELVAVCGRNEEGVTAFAKKHGWQSIETDWRKLVERDDIDAIDIGTSISSPGGIMYLTATLLHTTCLFHQIIRIPTTVFC